ncbi:MAG: DUF4169 family protein [Emcibacteraceae bacterium]|nr:DUF4169 family protein [Emcibacteraceae bacterium]MDG1858641.1 DUF4169 family protein [Emcibacteraceae bacterium]
MSEILSFSKAKKKKDRVLKETRAEENRAKFGRTKLQKEQDKIKSKKFVKLIDDHKIDD